jgi:ABC-type Fe3+-hydroxamate transport system substrate-binding protein
VSAVREKRVYFVDRGIELSSPAAIYAMEDLAKQLHP